MSSVRFLFWDDNLSKHQLIFTKLGVCIDIVEIWFGIADGQISSYFDGYLPSEYYSLMFLFPTNKLLKLRMR